MLTLGQQLLAKKKKERERVAVPSGVPLLDTSCYVKLISADGHVFVCHKDCAAASKVLKPLIFPELQQPGEDMELTMSSNIDVVVEGSDDVEPPAVVYPPPPSQQKDKDKKSADGAAASAAGGGSPTTAASEDQKDKPPPPPPASVVLPNMLTAGIGERSMLEDGTGATVIKFPYINGKLLEIVVQYFHYKQRYEHAADKRPPFRVEPAVALELLSVATKLQC